MRKSKGKGYPLLSTEIVKEIGYKAGESICYTNLGNTYTNLSDFKKAIDYFLKAEKIFTETGQIHYLKRFIIVYPLLMKNLQIMRMRKNIRDWQILNSKKAGAVKKTSGINPDVTFTILNQTSII